MNSVVQHRALDFWFKALLLALAVWLGASLCFDFLIMPMMYTSGMMQDASFSAMGSSLFGMFNHLEFLTAGLILTGLLILWRQLPSNQGNMTLLTLLAVGLIAIAALYTYYLSPQMGAIGLQMSQAETPSLVTEMNVFHGFYAILEVLKLVGLGFCLKRLYKVQTAL
jgi:hypothetical protein